ncbi:hypothetical protein BDZ91DRAFT_356048 [Kalaharituber pfeilii]|nr:hypothetical protein BDZ91DRAFT_356048 [Kalaharituber pfeilii]
MFLFCLLLCGDTNPSEWIMSSFRCSRLGAYLSLVLRLTSPDPFFRKRMNNYFQKRHSEFRVSMPICIAGFG